MDNFYTIMTYGQIWNRMYKSFQVKYAHISHAVSTMEFRN